MCLCIFSEPRPSAVWCIYYFILSVYASYRVIHWMCCSIMFDATVWRCHTLRVMCLKLIQLYKLFPWKWLFVKLMDIGCTISLSFPLPLSRSLALYAFAIDGVCVIRAKFATWIVANECELANRIEQTDKRERKRKDRLQQPFVCQMRLYCEHLIYTMYIRWKAKTIDDDFFLLPLLFNA